MLYTCIKGREQGGDNMAQLGIGDLTHGVSASGANDYVMGLNMGAINGAIKVLEDTSNVKATLEAGWQGRAEANFEKNLDMSVRTVVDTLELIKKNIENLVSDLVEDMANQDGSLVEAEDVVGGIFTQSTAQSVANAAQNINK